MAKDKTALARKRRQRKRDKKRGMTEVGVRVPASKAGAIKRAAARTRSKR